MTELRDEVARAISGAPFPSTRALRKADAAIAIVIERAAKAADSGPPFDYVEVGEKGADFDKPGSPYDRGVADERARILAAIRNLAPETTP